MSPYHLPIPDLLAAGRVVLDNMETEADLQAAMLPYGYDADAIAEARALHTQLANTTGTQVDQYGHQYDATDTLDDERAAFHRDTYMPHVSVARVAFRSRPGVLARLGLDRRRERDFAGWARQAHHFYDNLLADAALVAEMALRGVAEADLTDAQAALAGIETSDSTQENRKGLAQQSTHDRNALARAFAEWYADFRDLARVALRDTPEWLERLGIRHPSDSNPN